jgi:hypothetical protein
VLSPARKRAGALDGHQREGVPSEMASSSARHERGAWSDSPEARRTSQMTSKMTKIRTTIPGVLDVSWSTGAPATKSSATLGAAPAPHRRAGRIDWGAHPALSPARRTWPLSPGAPVRLRRCRAPRRSGTTDRSSFGPAYVPTGSRKRSLAGVHNRLLDVKIDSEQDERPEQNGENSRGDWLDPV